MNEHTQQSRADGEHFVTGLLPETPLTKPLGPERVAELVEQQTSHKRQPRNFFTHSGHVLVIREPSVFPKMMHELEGLGFWIGADREVQSKRIRNDYRQGARHRSHLRFTAQRYPRGLTIKFYVDGVSLNRNGPRYVFWDESKRFLGPFDALVLRHTVAHLRSALVKEGFVDASDPPLEHPEDIVEYHSRASWHFKGETSINLPRATEPYNDKDRDRRRLKNGDVKWFRTDRGDLRRGTAYHNINNMWWVVTGGVVRNLAAFELFDYTAEEPRTVPTRSTIRKLEHLMQQAATGQDFERSIIFRDEIARLKRGLPSDA